MISSSAPYGDLYMIPDPMQLLVEQTFYEELERACMSDMDRVLTKDPYRYAVPILDKRIISPIARANRQMVKGSPLERLSVVSARDVEAQLAVPGMPRGIFHFGGLGTRYFNPTTCQVIYTGDPEAACLCQQIINRLVSRLITAGRRKYRGIYWDNRIDGVNLLLEELPEARQGEVVKICQEIATEFALNDQSKLRFEYRLQGEEPNCDFLSGRMVEVGKGSALEDFFRQFPNIGFLRLMEDTKRWLKTFQAAAQAAKKREGSKLRGYCLVLVAPLPGGEEFSIEQVEGGWWITLSDQNVLARFGGQYETLLERLAAATA